MFRTTVINFSDRTGSEISSCDHPVVHPIQIGYKIMDDTWEDFPNFLVVFQKIAINY